MLRSPICYNYGCISQGRSAVITKRKSLIAAARDRVSSVIVIGGLWLMNSRLFAPVLSVRVSGANGLKAHSSQSVLSADTGLPLNTRSTVLGRCKELISP
jgi:hypothetical protein